MSTSPSLYGRNHRHGSDESIFLVTLSSTVLYLPCGLRVTFGDRSGSPTSLVMHDASCYNQRDVPAAMDFINPLGSCVDQPPWLPGSVVVITTLPTH